MGFHHRKLWRHIGWRRVLARICPGNRALVSVRNASASAPAETLVRVQAAARPSRRATWLVDAPQGRSVMAVLLSGVCCSTCGSRRRREDDDGLWKPVRNANPARAFCKERWEPRFGRRRLPRFWRLPQADAGTRVMPPNSCVRRVDTASRSGSGRVHCRSRERGPPRSPIAGPGLARDAGADGSSPRCGGGSTSRSTN